MNKKTIRVYIGLGSNLDNPAQQIRSAITTLSKILNTQLVQVSSFYRTPPIGPISNQPDFINAVAALDTTLTAHQLFTKLKLIERQQGRTRSTKRWGPRILDLDLLLYGDKSIHTQKLTVPHPGLTSRNFVLYPLAEIAPYLCLPNGITIQSLLVNCSSNDLEILHIL